MSSIYRREYEVPLKELKMPAHYYGYSNRILMQEAKDEINYFIPVYPILKIKSIQDIDIQKLNGSISCVIIIYVCIEKLPPALVHMLENDIQMQVNRSELVFLKEDRERNISVSKDKQNKMLKFTLRRNLSATIVSDTLWSPFEIIRLVISITFNSISKRKGMAIKKRFDQTEKKKEEQTKIEVISKTLSYSMSGNQQIKKKKSEPQDKVSFNEYKNYTISFNCMRNGSEVPISYSLGCVYSLYDLAEKKLDVYSTNIESYTEVIRTFQERNKPKEKDKNETKKKSYNFENSIDPSKELEIEIQEGDSFQQLETLTDQVFNYMHVKAEKKDKKVKAKYFQYTHFIIPLYKYPGNSLATIFIPMFLLALLSLAIFFQSNELSDRIGSIATMILGYIALIPSIKEQLPPSSKITVLEIVIYISTLSCLFSLVESFLIDDVSNYVFNWRTNPLFLMCLIIHISVFVFIGSLMVIHKFIWEPSYNIDVQGRKTDPEQDPHEWINPYCDNEFYKANSKIYQNNKKAESKKKQATNEEDKNEIENIKAKLIVKYTPVYFKQEKFSDNPLPIKKEQSFSHVDIEQKEKPFIFLPNIELIVEKKEKQPVTFLQKIEQKSQENEKKKMAEEKEKVEESEKKKENDKGDKGEKKKGGEKKMEFQFEKNLELLDKLILKGGHITWKGKQGKGKQEKEKVKKNLEGSSQNLSEGKKKQE